MRTYSTKLSLNVKKFTLRWLLPDCFAADGSVFNALKSQHFAHPRLISRRLISMLLKIYCNRRSVPLQSNTVSSQAVLFKISSGAPAAEGILFWGN